MAAQFGAAQLCCSTDATDTDISLSFFFKCRGFFMDHCSMKLILFDKSAWLQIWRGDRAHDARTTSFVWPELKSDSLKLFVCLNLIPDRAVVSLQCHLVSSVNSFRSGDAYMHIYVSKLCPAQRPVTLTFDVFFGLRPNNRLSQQRWGWWFETPSHPSWRHSN